MKNSEMKRSAPIDNEIQLGITLDEIMVFGSNAFPSVPLLLNTFTADVAILQYKWLEEVITGKIKPGISNMSKTTCKKWIRKYKQTPVWYESKHMKDPRERVLWIFHEMTSEARKRYTAIRYKEIDVDETSSASSYEYMQQIMDMTSSQRVIVQLQELFLLLCAHYMYPVAQYTEIYMKLEWNKNYLAAGERFIWELVSLRPESYASFMNDLLKRYPRYIPPSGFEGCLLPMIRGYKQRLLSVYDCSMDSVKTDESACSPGALNGDNQLTTPCPRCKTPWQKECQLRPACDAMFCTKGDCSHTFCFFCGEDIPYVQYRSGRPVHGSHFGKRPSSWSCSSTAADVDWGWCCHRPGVQPWGSIYKNLAEPRIPPPTSQAPESMKEATTSIPMHIDINPIVGCQQPQSIRGNPSNIPPTIVQPQESMPNANDNDAKLELEASTLLHALSMGEGVNHDMDTEDDVTTGVADPPGMHSQESMENNHMGVEDDSKAVVTVLGECNITESQKPTRRSDRVINPPDRYQGTQSLSSLSSSNSTKIKKKQKKRSRDKIMTAMELLESQGYLVTKVMSMGKRRRSKQVKSDKKVKTILEAIRSRDRPDLISDLKNGERCPDCGMLLIEVDNPAAVAAAVAAAVGADAGADADADADADVDADANDNVPTMAFGDTRAGDLDC